MSLAWIQSHRSHSPCRLCLIDGTHLDYYHALEAIDAQPARAGEASLVRIFSVSRSRHWIRGRKEPLPCISCVRFRNGPAFFPFSLSNFATLVKSRAKVVVSSGYDWSKISPWRGPTSKDKRQATSREAEKKKKPEACTQSRLPTIEISYQPPTPSPDNAHPFYQSYGILYLQSRLRYLSTCHREPAPLRALSFIRSEYSCSLIAFLFLIPLFVS